MSFVDLNSISGAVKSLSIATTMTLKPTTLQAGYVDDSDDAEMEWKTQVYDLAKTVSRLTKENATTNSTVASLQSTMTELNSSVQAMMKSMGKMPLQETVPQSTLMNDTPQVHPSFVNNMEVFR